MIGIYKITNPKGLVYVGQSTDIERRWWGYKKLRKNEIGTKLFYSLNKYKPKNHVFEIIEECPIEQLTERETYWTLQYNALHPNGLVLQIGGKHGYMTEESKLKMSLAKKGKPNFKLKGFKYNEDSKTIMSLAKNKAILQYDKNLNLIKEWISIKEASIYLNLNGPHISRVCRGIKKTAGGFIWKFKII